MNVAIPPPDAGEMDAGRRHGLKNVRTPRKASGREGSGGRLAGPFYARLRSMEPVISINPAPPADESILLHGPVFFLTRYTDIHARGRRAALPPRPCDGGML